MRCVSDAEIGTEFRRAFHESVDSRPHGGPPIKIDVIGLKLLRFLEDQLDWIDQRNIRVEVRLILQLPIGEVFDAICLLEGRERSKVRADIEKTISRFGSKPTVIDQTLTTTISQMQISLRFTDRYQPITLFRTGDTCCVRPRVSTPQGAATRFYEKYLDGFPSLYFRVYQGHFESTWNASSYTPSELQRALKG